MTLSIRKREAGERTHLPHPLIFSFYRKQVKASQSSAMVRLNSLIFWEALFGSFYTNSEYQVLSCEVVFHQIWK